MLLPRLWNITKDAAGEWVNDKATKLAASLAYYTAFSLAPLLILMVAILSFIYGQSAAQGRVADQMQRLIGGRAANATQEMVKHASQQGGGTLATILSIAIILFSASGVFGELQDSMNVIWGVQPKPGRGFMDVVKDRFFSMAMVFGIIFLLLVSLVISTLVSAMSTRMTGSVHIVARAIDVIVSIGVIAVLFMMLFKFLPDVKVRWRDVVFAGILTSVLFTIGKYLLGLYLGRSSTTSAYGAAGSFAALLLWVYYSAQILFFGAEFSKAYAKTSGRLPLPTANAVPMSPQRKAELGIAPDRQSQAARVHFVEPSAHSSSMPFGNAL